MMYRYSTLGRLCKHSFLRELREVAPEMELFLEYHSLGEKYFVTKLLNLQSFQLATLQNYLYLKELTRKWLATFF